MMTLFLLPTEQALAHIFSLAREVVANRFRPDAEDQRDMLGSFIRHGVSKSQCESEIPFQIIAGSDTTAHAIRGTLLYLMSSPQAYSALQREIDEAAARGSISKPATTAQAKQLPYLQAVIYEGLRMNPPSSHLMMKAIPPEGETVDGYFIPGGTRIATNMKPIMRDPETFGGDADVFNPARWLGLEPAQRKRMVDTVELVFGSGRWGCSGKTVAYVELNKTFVELFRNFDLQLVNPRRPIDESRNIQVWIEKGMWAKVTDREAVSATVSEKVAE
jgi:cytochrome P450